MKLEEQLNKCLCDLSVLYAKIQNYHWYVRGKSFLQVHAQLESYYDAVAAQRDEVAEKMLQIGGKPVAGLKAFLAGSEIKEAEGQEISVEAALGSVLTDFTILLQQATALKECAEEEENHLISVLADELIEYYSKARWMLTSSIEN